MRTRSPQTKDIRARKNGKPKNGLDHAAAAADAERYDTKTVDADATGPVVKQQQKPRE
jgi:hypothetical protein